MAVVRDFQNTLDCQNVKLIILYLNIKRPVYHTFVEVTINILYISVKTKKVPYFLKPQPTMITIKKINKQNFVCNIDI